MTDPREPMASGAGDLQFDQAEFATVAPGGPACAACKRGLIDMYYEVNGALVCPECQKAVASGRALGSGFVRFVRASVYGMGAAVAGFLIYFAVMKLAHMQIGLISILVGFMVGASVRTGARHRGGAGYQLLAVFLTYTAIAASYSATFVPKLIADMKQKEAAGDAEPAKKAEPAGGAKPKAAGAEKAKAAGAEKAPAPAPARRDNLPPLSVATVLLALVAVLGFMYALPVLFGIESPIGLFIVAFALWEAWKLNRRVPITFRGPFTLGGAEPNPEGTAAHA